MYVLPIAINCIKDELKFQLRLVVNDKLRFQCFESITIALKRHINRILWFLQLWEQTQAENTRLRLELSGVKNENETLKHQLGSAAQQVSFLFMRLFSFSKSNLGFTNQCNDRCWKERKTNSFKEASWNGRGAEGCKH